MGEKKEPQPPKIKFANGSEINIVKSQEMTSIRGINFDNIYVLTNDKEMDRNEKN